MAKFAIVQLNSIPGDFEGNSRRILSALNLILAQGVGGADDRIVFSLGALGGWPLADLRFDPYFETQYYQAQKRLLALFPNLKAKIELPDEIWPPKGREGEPASDSLVSVEWESDPFLGDMKTRSRVRFTQYCKETNRFGIYCCSVGGQDTKIYFGSSFICDNQGRIVAKAKAWQQAILLFDVETGASQEWNADGCSPSPDWKKTNDETALCSNEYIDVLLDSTPWRYRHLPSIYSALKLGIRDYVEKNGFHGTIVGLSGGIDSALVAALAVDALGSERVTGVTMPSRYSSVETQDDATRLAQSLGVEMFTLPISEPYAAFSSQLTESLMRWDGSADPQNLTDQNLQARIRGVYLMTLSNRSGRVVLNTSNKSEAAVGYGTLYGDLVGGLGVISDVWKTDVWALSRLINEIHGYERIPVSTIERIPSAELRDNQQDRDSIPDYPILDPIMQLYIEERKNVNQIISEGFNPEDVTKCVALFNRNEFKRRQCVPGLSVSIRPLVNIKLPMTKKYSL